MSIIVNSKVRNYIAINIGQHINSPQQRLIQGATALAMQPFIDFHNKKADEDTRAVSVARTIGKIVAGTAVGVGVRFAAIWATKKFSAHDLIVARKAGEEIVTGIKKKSKKDIFTPVLTAMKGKWTPEEFEIRYDRYVKTMGTVVATVAMIFTNFLIDAPLTKVITKVLTKPVRAFIDEKESEVKNGDS